MRIKPDKTEYIYIQKFTKQGATYYYLIGRVSRYVYSRHKTSFGACDALQKYHLQQARYKTHLQKERI